MSMIYKPVLIETEEQAAALPVGTIAHCQHARDHHPVFVAARALEGWVPAGQTKPYGHVDVIGWTALVPVEARTEYAIHDSWDGDYEIIHESRLAEFERFRGVSHQPLMARTVTEWEAAL